MVVNENGVVLKSCKSSDLSENSEQIEISSLATRGTHGTHGTHGPPFCDADLPLPLPHLPGKVLHLRYTLLVLLQDSPHACLFAKAKVPFAPV